MPLTPPDTPIGTVTPRDLQVSLEHAVDRGIPGISAAIATRDGIVWEAAAGWADIERQYPLEQNHVFGAGSITKVLVASVVLQLAQNDRDLLRRTPTDILGRQILYGIANAEQATLGQLLSHTSGIASWEDDPRWIRAGRGCELDTKHAWRKTQPLDYVRGHTPLFAPGTRYSYSNTNHTLLGLVIEALTGETAEAQIRRRIIEPLALHSMYLEGFELAGSRRAPRRYHHATPEFIRAAGINEEFREVRPGLIDVSTSNLSVEWTAGALMSTPADLAMFGFGLRTGKLLSEDGMRYLMQWTPTGENSDVGHGVFRFHHPAGPLIGHTGNVLGFSSCLFWDPNSDGVVVVSTNLGSMHAGDRAVNAGSIALHTEFTNLALRFVRQ